MEVSETLQPGPEGQSLSKIDELIEAAFTLINILEPSEAQKPFVERLKTAAAAIWRQRYMRDQNAQALQIRAILVQKFPAAFKGRGQSKPPLKTGIFEDLVAAIPELSPDRIKIALNNYTSRPTYLRNLIARAPRIDLDGNPCGVVTEDQACRARAFLRRFEQKETK